MSCRDGRRGGGISIYGLVCGRDHRTRGFTSSTTHGDESQLLEKEDVDAIEKEWCYTPPFTLLLSQNEQCSSIRYIDV
jgi:hypothetical protein